MDAISDWSIDENMVTDVCLIRFFVRYVLAVIDHGLSEISKWVHGAF